MLLVSASEIDLFSNCQRKWAFKHIEGIRPRQGDAQKLGDEVEKEQLTPYLTEGRTFDFTKERESGYIAASLVSLLPPPKTEGMILQKRFIVPSPQGTFGYIGYRDLFVPDSSVIPGAKGGVPFVGDFKTTSDFKWAKTEEDLRKDTQSVLYQIATMFELGARELDLGWFYAKTRKPYRAKVVHLRVVGDDVASQFERVDDVAGRVVATKKENPKPHDLEPNAAFCNAFNRPCEYTHLCNLSPAVTVSGGVDMSAGPINFDFLAKMKGEAPAPAPAPAQTISAGTPVVPDAAGFAMPHWATAPVDPMNVPKMAINPPESTLPPAPPVGVSAAPATEAEKPTRKRRTKAEMEAARASEASSVGAGVGTRTPPGGGSEEPGIEHAPESGVRPRVARLSLEITVEPGETLTAAVSRAFGELMSVIGGAK